VLTVAIIGYNAALKLTAAWEAIVEALNPFAYIAIAAVVATLLIVRYWKPISQFFEGIWKHIRGVVMGAFHAITLAVKVYVALFKFEWNVLKAVATSVWNAIHATVTGVFHSLMSAWNTVKNAFITGWNAVKTAGMAIWDAIVGAAKGALNGLISLWDSTIGRIAHGQHIGVGPLHVTLPNLYVPMMAEGGIVSAPTLAMIGEAGPEAVVPLNKLGSMGGGHTIAGSLTLTPDGRAFIRGVVVDENTQEAKHAASLQRQRRTR
jgi:hypothetical protein